MHRYRTLVVACAAVALAAGPATLAHASSGDDGHPDRSSHAVPLDPSTTGNNPEGVAWDPDSRTYFVGIVSTGVIYRATLDDATLTPFITPDPAGPADSAVGMKVRDGKLYVAGGPTGSIYVYDIATATQLARFETGPGGFLNDLVVTGHGDVYVTDSQRPTIWHLTPGMVDAGTGTPEGVPVGPEITYVAGFNLNGIVARHGGDELIVVNSATKSFFRIRIDADDTAARSIEPIEAPALGGDGLLIDRGRLLVVTGNPAAVTRLKLKHHDTRARLDDVITDPFLVGSSTIARAEHVYLVVNANFGGPAPYTVAVIPRSGGHSGHSG